MANATIYSAVLITLLKTFRQKPESYLLKVRKQFENIFCPQKQYISYLNFFPRV